MTDRPKLFSLHVSPWSERVRWALDHHGVDYQKIQHAPFIGELRLRRATGGRKTRATVPLLVDGDEVLTESWEIAKYADRVGTGAKLIPADREKEIKSWNDLADHCCAEGRALIMAAMLRTPEALDESLPPAVPGFVRPLMRPMGRFGVRWFSKKYELQFDDLAAHEQEVREGLERVRAVLKNGYLIDGAFSYADIVMTTLLQAITPVSDDYLRLGPATRKVWTNDTLAGEFSDLVRWRDELYVKHRALRAARRAI